MNKRKVPLVVCLMVRVATFLVQKKLLNISTYAVSSFAKHYMHCSSVSAINDVARSLIIK